ncbi:MAG: hypothetical protein NTX50_25025, partial [Candidatus Sumerlaeota bacterium]|nr:hypothetical protein [Candidatus Sumerlaeota bacterium]
PPVVGRIIGRRSYLKHPSSFWGVLYSGNIIIFLLCSIIICITLIDASGGNSTADLLYNTSRARFYVDLASQYSPYDLGSFSKSQSDHESYSNIARKFSFCSEVDYYFTSFYWAIAAKMNNQMAEARKWVENGTKAGADDPEFLFEAYGIFCIGDSMFKQVAKAYLDKEAIISPLSPAARRRDSVLSDEITNFDPGRLPPRIGKNPTFFEESKSVSNLYFEMGLLRPCIDVLVEASYHSPDDNTYSDRSQLWQKVAELETEDRQTSLAIRAWLKSVFNDRTTSEIALGKVRDLLDGDAYKNAPTLRPIKWNIASVITISNFYRKSNLHPFAMNLIRQAQETLHDNMLEKEMKIAKEEWDQIVKQYIQTYGRRTGTYYFFGISAKDVKDWSQVHIPRPSDTFWKPSIMPKSLGH